LSGLWDIFEQNWGIDDAAAAGDTNAVPRSDLLAILDHNPDDDYDYGHSGDEEPELEAPVEETDLMPESPQLGLEGMDDSQYPADIDSQVAEPLPEILDESQREPPIDPAPSGASASVEMPPPPVPPRRTLDAYKEKCRREILSKMAVVRLGQCRVCP